MLYDTHLHTCFSDDSEMDLADVRRKMLEINIGVTVTEHIDLNYPDPSAFKLDVQGYFAAYAQYRTDRLLIGVEIGMDSENSAGYRRMTEEYPFDYVLGSIHVVDGLDLYDEIFYRHKTKQEVYARYFDATLECIRKYDFIDSLAHIDYIARYTGDREINYREHCDRIDQILAALAVKGKCLELNTRRLGEPQAAENLLPIYQRFRELGGRWITIGSDAHRASDIGKHFATATEMAEYCKLRPVWFNRRRMKYL